MCLIVDNCEVANFFSNTARLQSIKTHVYTGRSRYCYGGTKQLKEFPRSYLGMLAELDRAGKAKQFPAADIDRLHEALAPKCTSDDPHVIALAVVSGARLLCTADADLMTDFDNPSLIDNPRGKIYQNESHKKLLRQRCKRCNPRKKE